MVLYVQENEMIERFADSLKKSASRAKEFTEADESDRPKIFVDFIDGIKVAAGSAHQLAHAQENPFWLQLRDLLEKVIEISSTFVRYSPSQKKHWNIIKVSLEHLASRGITMARAKPISRENALVELDNRAKAAALELEKSDV